ncbi:hypothetical protein D3C87_2050150 [compost metagenome]
MADHCLEKADFGIALDFYKVALRFMPENVNLYNQIIRCYELLDLPYKASEWHGRMDAAVLL